MAYQLPTANRSSGSGFPTANPADPSYYPQRNSIFGQDPRASLRGGVRDSHEMGPTSRRASVGTGRTGRVQGAARGDQHAFGDDSDSDDSSADGQGFNVYNGTSSPFQEGARADEAVWPDFNNKGQRYSAAVSTADRSRDDPFASTTSGFGSVGGKGSYAPTSTSPEGAAAKDEMVMMPHLGQDWDDKEAQRDKRWEGKVGRKTLGLKSKTGRAQRGVNSWMRGERKCWGWLGWRQGVFLTFFSLAGLAVMLYFVIPRTPTLAYNNQSLLAGDDGSINWNRTPANFTLNANMSLALDGRSSYVAPRVSNLKVIVNDLGSTPGTVEVGTGTVGSLTASTKQYTPLNVPIVFKYTASNSSDPLWNTWYGACGHEWAGNTTRQTLQLSVVVSFNVVGLIGSRSESTQLNGVNCPVQLPANAA